ncbi:MAG: diguanylate cyclase [Rhodanobacter sp.]
MTDPANIGGVTDLVNCRDQLSLAQARVAALNAQVDGLHLHLAELGENLARAEGDTAAGQLLQLRQANEKLLLAVLKANASAEVTAANLRELARANQHDALTGTPNRVVLLERLEAGMAAARRDGTQLAVIFIDLDGFKQINDTLGHAAGDEALRVVARRMTDVVRASDSVSRHGGDEFLALLSDVARQADADAITKKILSAIARPCRIGGKQIQLSASAGIALYPRDGENALSLIRSADAAMYQAKRAGHGLHRHADAAVERNPTAQPMPSADPAEGEPELLREANGKLVAAVLSAQAGEDVAHEANRKQIKFMAMVAHELRNPLTPIRIASDLLLQHDYADAASVARLQSIIDGQVTHMARLIDDLLDGSRLSTGKLRMERRAIDLQRVISIAIDTCRPAMLAKAQAFTSTLPPDALAFHGDAIRLTQVFSNLLDNACKYTPMGGHIALNATISRSTIVISVADDGIGIGATELHPIFDLFVQDEHGLTMANGGLGIGLAVVRDLVSAHGGSVVAHSPGRGLGSTFVVTLPRDAGTDAAAD